LTFLKEKYSSIWRSFQKYIENIRKENRIRVNKIIKKKENCKISVCYFWILEKVKKYEES